VTARLAQGERASAARKKGNGKEKKDQKRYHETGDDMETVDASIDGGWL
jgi:hypothetical protein